MVMTGTPEGKEPTLLAQLPFTVSRSNPLLLTPEGIILVNEGDTRVFRLSMDGTLTQLPLEDASITDLKILDDTFYYTDRSSDEEKPALKMFQVLYNAHDEPPNFNSTLYSRVLYSRKRRSEDGLE